MTESQNNRRDFLAKASAALAIVSVPTESAGGEKASSKIPETKLQPEEFWRERMTAPDDGKRYGWFVDTGRCFGCHACEVSCKAENDVPLGNFIRQTIYKDVGRFPKVARVFLPISCQHCEDAPCIKACPSGALHKGTGGSVLVDYNTCCGHASCVDACPYGAIYLDPVAQQAVKCHNCFHRVDEGLEPACASTCPSGAIHFGDLNDPDSKVTRAIEAAENSERKITQLRPEKKTRPRMWFAGKGPQEIEERVPREGHSFHHDAYNIHQWKDEPDA